MDSSLHEVWQAAEGSPFLPTVGKGTQFLVGSALLLSGVAATGVFALSTTASPLPVRACGLGSDLAADRSLVNLTVIGIPASLALAYVVTGCDGPGSRLRILTGAGSA